MARRMLTTVAMEMAADSASGVVLTRCGEYTILEWCIPFARQDGARAAFITCTRRLRALLALAEQQGASFARYAIEDDLGAGHVVGTLVVCGTVSFLSAECN